MLKIIAADETAPADKRYADACWRANPRIAASWWREAQGHTVGKIGLDWRKRVTQQTLLEQGFNLVLAAEETYAGAVAAMAAAQAEEGALHLWLTTASPLMWLENNPQPQPGLVLLWQPEAGGDEIGRHAVLKGLEEACRAGKISGYGLADADLAQPDTPLPLHGWLEEASQAAAVVWGRRKRPALRYLLANLDWLEPGWLTVENTQHHGQEVGALELAARLGLMVVAVQGARPLPPGAVPSAAALGGLQKAAEAEQGLNAALGGWPQVAGRRVFSVLEALAAGRPPWPSPAAWRLWRRHQLPLLEELWRAQVATKAATQAGAQLAQQVEGYLLALRQLEEGGEELANHAAQKTLAEVLGRVSAGLPPVWRWQPAPVLAAGLLGGLPGVAAVALPGVEGAESLQSLGDFADMGAVFGCFQPKSRAQEA